MLANNTRIRLNKAKEGDSGEILEVSGLVYKYDSKQMAIDSNNILISVEVNGKPVEDNKIYIIVTNNFVVSQFKKFFGDIDEKPEFKNSGYIDRDIIIEAVQNQKVIDSKLEKRIIDISE